MAAPGLNRVGRNTRTNCEVPPTVHLSATGSPVFVLCFAEKPGQLMKSQKSEESVFIHPALCAMT